MASDIHSLERELREAGHQVERTYEAPVRSQQRRADAEWVFRIDGEVVARGEALATLEDNLRQWMAARQHG